MSLLQQRRRQIAESLLGTTEPAGPQMEPEVSLLQAWREKAAKRLGTLGSLADPMTWYRAIGSLPPPDSPEAKALFRHGGQGLFDIAMDWGVNPLAGGLLGTFKGMNANLSDTERDMLAKAFELEQKGMGREAIRQATNPPGGSGGWFRAPWDKKWRMELDDSAAVSGIYSLPRLKEEMEGLAVNLSEYEGGVSIGSFICRRAGEKEMEYVAFYAFAPMYDFSNITQIGGTIRIENDYKAWLAVIKRLNFMLKLDFDYADLEKKSQELMQLVDNKIDELDKSAPQLGIRDYIRKLSEDYNEMPFEPLDDVWEDESRRLMDKFEG